MAWYRVNDLHDDRLQLYRQIKKSNLTRWSGRFIAEGRKVVERLLQSEFEVESVLLSEHRVDEFQELIPHSADVYVLPLAEATQLVGYNFHSGVLACGLRKPQPPLESLIDDSPCRTTLAILPNVNDPENLGSIIRLAAGFGVQGVLVGRSGGDPFSRRALRVSMATALAIPVIRYDDLEQRLTDLRVRHGFELVASVLSEQAEPLDSVDRRRRVGILFGSEGHGLGQPWTGLSTRHVTVPMHHGTDSLNVAMAAAVFLYHFQQVAAVVEDSR